jgi:type IV fimbrial biogenesis protein FimT
MLRESGFTLVELMVTVALMAIVLTVGVPSFSELIRSNRLTTQANEILGALALARSEAVKRAAPVSITTASGDSNWKAGWTVAVAGGADLRVYSAQKGSHTLASDDGYSSFQYDSQGFIDNGGTLSLCTGSGETGRQIVISPSGHARVDGSYVCP